MFRAQKMIFAKGGAIAFSSSTTSRIEGVKCLIIRLSATCARQPFRRNRVDLFPE
jgi:hypothetical protein